jgi:hypothetical protein
MHWNDLTASNRWRQVMGQEQVHDRVWTYRIQLGRVVRGLRSRSGASLSRRNRDIVWLLPSSVLERSLFIPSFAFLLCLIVSDGKRLLLVLMQFTTNDRSVGLQLQL